MRHRVAHRKLGRVTAHRLATLRSMATSLFEQTKVPRLCLAGGCGYNSVANGMVFDRSPFRDLYVQAAAGDAGGAIGAAYWVWNQELRNARSFVMDSPFSESY